MSEKRKLDKIALLEFLVIVIFSELTLLSLWLSLPVWITVLLLLGVVYGLLHLIFGPLDWYLIYLLYIRYKANRARRKFYKKVKELNKKETIKSD